MDKLKTLQHSISNLNNRSNILYIYIWRFYDSNNVLQNLEYKHAIYNINTLNKISRIREDIQHITKKYSVSSSEYKSIHHPINDIDNWLIDNFKYLEKSNDNYIKSHAIITYITSELGEYNYALTYEVGWSVKDIYKLYIDLYSSKIILDYKGKETQLSEQKLKTFIQKNKKIILQAKENQYKKYIQRVAENREKERLEQLTKDLEEQRLISIADCDATRKVGSRHKCESFIIKRSLKERYETQACKPLPVKYPWLEQ